MCSADGARIVLRTRDEDQKKEEKKKNDGDERLPCCVIRTEISPAILVRGGGGGGPSKNGPFPRPVASAGVSGGGELRFDQSWSL